MKYIALAVFMVLLVSVFPARAMGQDLPRYTLEVTLRPEAGGLNGVAVIVLPEPTAEEPWLVHMGSLTIESARLGDREMKGRIRDGVLKVDQGGQLSVGFSAVFGHGAREAGPDNAGVVRGNAITPEYTMLQGGWYPYVEAASAYSLSVRVPEGFTVISEADSIARTQEGDVTMFEFTLNSPVEGVTMVAGRYDMLAEQVGGVSVETYFMSGDESLARSYLDYSIRYIKAYSTLIGPFPYGRFAVVEGMLPTGYSMPTYTLMGQSVVRLPFIVKTSLGHEVLHQWFGNSVRTTGGNWAEGLVAYMADHYYEELNGTGAAHRKRLLLDYASYVPRGSALSLADFAWRTDLATRSVGYGKGAMVFNMLRREVGDDAFMRGLRDLYSGWRDRAAGWDALREVFEGASGRELGWFFDQWVTRPGVLELSIDEVRHLRLEQGNRVSFVVSQGGGEVRDFLLPVSVITDAGVLEDAVRVEKKTQAFELPVKGEPREIVFDRDYDLMRTPGRAETPATVSMLIGGGSGLIVLPDSDEAAAAYAPIVGAFEARGYKSVREGELKYGLLASGPSIVCREASGAINMIFGSAPADPSPEAGVSMEVLRNPLSPDEAMAIVRVSSVAEAEAGAGKIPHYGRYSRLAFTGGRNVMKEVSGSEEGIRRGLALDVVGIRPSEAISLEDIITEVSDKPVIYVGEGHTYYEHHKVQLEFIRRLHEKGKKIAIGMEMFQRPYQEALDRYISGQSGEKELLVESEYYTRWKFDFLLYREILEYARGNGIPVVALNQKNEIVSKAAKGGLDALSQDERAMLPPALDLTDFAYRQRLVEIFGSHAKGKQFDNFYLAQIIWDETMAYSIAEYLGLHPERQMVVITGQGHTAWRSGIPARVERLTGLDYALIVQDEGGSLSPARADYVLFTPSMEAPQSPMLGVMISPSDKGVRVDKLTPGGPADSSGIRQGDIIVRVGQSDIKSVADLRLALYGHRAGDVLDVNILRKRFLLGYKSMDVTVDLR